MRQLFFAIPLLFLAVGCGPVAPKQQPSGPARPAVAALPEVTVPRAENPRYTQWAKHPVGTVVTVREKTATPTFNTAVTTTYKLTALKDDRAVVEVGTEIQAPDGTKYPPTTSEQVFVRWVSGSETEAAKLGRPQGTVSERAEKLTVLGKEYATTCYKSKGHVEAGETVTETWIAADFPGGVVKSIHAIPASKKTVTSEVVSVVRP